MTNLIGQSLGRYHILEQLGEGGMATVYKAIDTRMDAEVAVKVIRTENLTLGTMDRTLKRFEREAKSLARLTHPNIVKVMDYGEYEGKPYLVMPYLPGGTLKARLGKPMQWQEAAAILIPISRALAYAHKQDIIHRDVKPANILITDEGEPMLSDFGVAKLLDADETMELTGTGVGIGTPEYMAPEQGNSKSIDHRADIYSLGVVFYEMVTGRKPYTADTPLAILIKRASEPLPRPKQFVAEIPQGVENVLFKALAKEPNDRYQNMGDFTLALEGLVTGKGGKKPVHKQRKENKPAAFKPRTLLAIGLVVIAIGLIAGFAKPLLALTSQVVGSPALGNLSISTIAPMTGKDGMTLLYVPAGKFTMGSADSLKSNEKPEHQVDLSAFWIDRIEVTNAMYAKCVDAGQCSPPREIDHYSNPGYANHPVVYVNWDQANAYCTWADRELPSEAQWEKAARGTDMRTYPWGERIDCNHVNYSGCVGDTTETGIYESGISPYGAYDMSGNVWEWVYDRYNEYYYRNSPASNPLGPESGQYRILRGGSWDYVDSGVRTTNRYSDSALNAYHDYGFRCAQGASP
jgi:formylglycine-generating enzyme required for sulfatase activity/tRNA A-37 threonylcarbamoyl transferase component Bud32